MKLVTQKIDMYLCKIARGKGGRASRVYAIKRDDAGNRKTLRAVVAVVVAHGFPRARAVLRASRKSKIDFRNESDERSGRTCPLISRTVFAQGRRKYFTYVVFLIELLDKLFSK